MTAAKARARPFRLTEEEPPEVKVQVAIAHALSVLLLPPAVFTAMPIGHIQLSGQQAARLARIGTKRNWPDFIIIHNDPYGLEVKCAGGSLSRARFVPTRKGGRRWVEGQRDEFPRLEAAGMRIAVVESVDAALAALTAWGVPLRIARERAA